MRIISNKTLKAFYGNPIYSDSKQALDSWYHEALKANKIQVRKLYNLRHTFASQLIAAGEDITFG